MNKITQHDYRGCAINVYIDEHGALDVCPIQELAEDDAVIWAVWERNSIFSCAKYRPVEDPLEMEAWCEENSYECFQLYKYEHGGVEYSLTPFSCPWDSGPVGYLAVKRSAFNAPKKTAKSFVRLASAWCNGEVYGFVAEDGDGKEIDSCWGFVGDDGHDRNSYLLQMAKDSIDYHLRELANLPSRYQEVADAALDY